MSGNASERTKDAIRSWNWDGLTVYHEFEFNQIQHYELQKLPLRLEVMFPYYIKLWSTCYITISNTQNFSQANLQKYIFQKSWSIYNVVLKLQNQNVVKYLGLNRTKPYNSVKTRVSVTEKPE